MKQKTNRIQPSCQFSKVAQAIALLLAVSPAFGQDSNPVSLGSVTLTGAAPVTLEAAESAPSQGNLEARSAQSTVSDYFVRNFVSPVADYTQIINATPGAYSFSPNGVGLSDNKITIRGLSDANMVVSFDGIPFNDTNGVSHHSWTFFPSQFLGGALVDRGPGTGATIGQATYGGSIDLRSRNLDAEASSSVTVSHGTWNTNLINVEHQTGQFGDDGKNTMMFNVHEMKSNGYQPYNLQDRQGFSVKFQRQIDAVSTLTVFADYMDLKSNTPSIKGISRADYNNGTYNNLLSGDPTKANFYGYNFYDVPSTFEYVGYKTQLGDGWSMDNKAYHYSYHNKQNYNGSGAPNAGSAPVAPATTGVTAYTAVDKLNAYSTYGNILRLAKETSMGTLRTGVWIEKAFSDRYQIPAIPSLNQNAWVDSPVPNFHETYTTTTLQPYVEHEFKLDEQLSVTPGLKLARYGQNFLHYQDNGGAVGTLGATATQKDIANKTIVGLTGGSPSVTNAVTYSDVLPSIDAHYKFDKNWTGYVQYAYGDQIPSTSVFDVPNALLTPAPKAIKAKAFQAGSVWVSKELTLAADIYQIKLDGAYTSSTPDQFGNVTWTLTGAQTAQGVEAEANYALGGGFSVYGNATIGSLKYDASNQPQSGMWVAGAPRDTEMLALTYDRNGWRANLSVNRIGKMYNNGASGSSTVYQAFAIDPVIVTNLFINYTDKMSGSFFKQARYQLGINNLMNKHSIVAIAGPASGSTTAAPSTSDLLTVLPARSVNLTGTFNF